MSFKILDFYKISSPLAGGETDSEDSSRFKRIRWATFLSATTGYGIYYVCRLSMNVVRKPIVEELSKPQHYPKNIVFYSVNHSVIG